MTSFPVSVPIESRASGLFAVSTSDSAAGGFRQTSSLSACAKLNRRRTPRLGATWSISALNGAAARFAQFASWRSNTVAACSLSRFGFVEGVVSGGG